MKLKNILFVLLMIPMLLLTGCWSSREINTLAMAICIGIDKTPSGYSLTQQVLNSKAIASAKSINEPAVILYSEEGTDLFEMIRRSTTECPRRIYYSHLRMVVIGEDVAQDGLNSILDFLNRDHEIRSDFYFVVAKGTTANEVLSVLTPLESVPGIEMFSSLKTSEKVWAPTKSIKIVELINNIIAEGKNPVLTGLEITGGKTPPDTLSSLEQIDMANKLRYVSLGAFKEDKLVGWLSEDESKGYNYILGNVKNTVGYIEQNDNIKITLEVIKAKSKIKAYLLEGKPAINVEIKIEQNVAAVKGDFDVSKEENLDKINKLSEKRLTKMCNSVLLKTQKDLKTDIFGFGEAIHRAYPEVWKKIKADWDNEYTNLPVSITLQTKTKQLGQITKPFFMKGND